MTEYQTIKWKYQQTKAGQEELKKRYEVQQTEIGGESCEMVEWMKNQYWKKLNIPFKEIKSGRVVCLTNEHTGEKKYLEQ